MVVEGWAKERMEIAFLFGQGKGEDGWRDGSGLLREGGVWPHAKQQYVCFP